MKADMNKTVDELMKEVPRTGNRYLDLATGEFLDAAPIPAAPAKEKPDEPKKYTKEDLEAMKMSELRKIGKPIGAKDTKKSELISEIIEFQ